MIFTSLKYMYILCMVKDYRLMGYFRVTKFPRFCLKTWRLFFADFDFCGRQNLRKIILVLFRKNYRWGDITRLSLDRSTVRKENLWPKYLKRKGIKDTCSLADTKNKQKEHIYVQTVE